jgi:hypothetical protein
LHPLSVDNKISYTESSSDEAFSVGTSSDISSRVSRSVDFSKRRKKLIVKKNNTSIYPFSIKNPKIFIQPTGGPGKNNEGNYIGGGTLEERESTQIEYKQNFYSYDDQVKNICGFLNSVEGGKLIYGVSDNRVVYGISLNEKEIDSLKQFISNKIKCCIFPLIMVGFYNVYFKPVVDQNNVQFKFEDRLLYIVEITVKPGLTDQVYSCKTENGDEVIVIRQINSNSCLPLNKKEEVNKSLNHLRKQKERLERLEELRSKITIKR